jgi:crotonobetaine/carnitine-CoA ligase
MTMKTTEMRSPGERTIHHLLQLRADNDGGRAFFWFRDQSYCYADLNGMANRVAAGVQSLGVGKGDTVAVMMSNRPEFLAVVFGLSKLGAVEVPINTAHRGYLLSYQMNQADCIVLVVEHAFLPLLQEIAGDLPRLRDVVVVDGGEDTAPLPGRRCHRYELLTGNDGRYAPVDVRWSDPLAIMFTSGTTGPSKGAVLPQNYAIHLAEISCSIANYGPGDCLYNALPLFHGNAQLLSTLPALLSGARMVLAEKFSATRFWSDIRRYGCTEFNYIGSILAILLKAEPRPDDADNPLRVMFGAGATPGLHEAFEKRFDVKLVEGYGMSEIGLPLLSDPGDVRPGSCGKPHPDYEVMLVDDEGRELGANVPGELLVRPRANWSMMLSYYKMPEKTVEAWQGLWFHTGDYLRRDDDGFYYFIDRKKDAIRRRGENISSYEVERLVMRHPAVLEAAAIPIRSELGEDEVMVCVVLRSHQGISAPDLAEYCGRHMAKFMVPRYIRFVPALPKTPTQKVQKYQLREAGVTSDTWDGESLRENTR